MKESSGTAASRAPVTTRSHRAVRVRKYVVFVASRQAIRSLGIAFFHGDSMKLRPGGPATGRTASIPKGLPRRNQLAAAGRGRSDGENCRFRLTRQASPPRLEN